MDLFLWKTQDRPCFIALFVAFCMIRTGLNDLSPER